MKRIHLLAVFSLIALLALSSPAAAQSARGGRNGVSTQMKTQGCWVCGQLEGGSYCTAGVPGDWNCNVTFPMGCASSSPGCGGGGMLPLDPDGAAQYVSRGSAIGLNAMLSEDETPVRRNCEGVVVARYQAPDNIANVRAHTGSLSL